MKCILASQILLKNAQWSCYQLCSTPLVYSRPRSMFNHHKEQSQPLSRRIEIESALITLTLGFKRLFLVEAWPYFQLCSWPYSLWHVLRCVFGMMSSRPVIFKGRIMGLLLDNASSEQSFLQPWSCASFLMKNPINYMSRCICVLPHYVSSAWPCFEL